MEKGLKMLIEQHVSKFESYLNLKQQMDNIKAEMDNIKSELIKEMNGEEVVENESWFISNKQVISKRLDTKTFKLKHEEIYNRYLKEIKSHRFNLKRKELL